MNKELKITICGNIFGTDGYSNHSRGLANSLYKFADVKLNTGLIPNWERFVNDEELDMITKNHKENCINVIITIPHAWKLFLGTGINCCYCVWEGDKIPLSYIDEMLNSKVNYILVPSEHTKQSIVNTLIDWSVKNSNNDEHLRILEKIRIIPHGVDFSSFNSLRKKDMDEPQDVSISGDTKQKQGEIINNEEMPVEVDNHAEVFTFVCNKGWRGTNWDRGGIQYLLKAFNEEFTKSEKVRLIVKLNPAYMPPQQLQQSIMGLGLRENGGHIHITLEEMNPKQRAHLFNKSNVYVCPTRAEAFDLGSAEAMACGLPVITTNYGGQIEHMDESCSLLCKSEMEEVKEDIMYEGISWAKIDIEDLRNKLRWCYENQDKVKEMGIKAEQKIKEFDWDNSAKRIIEIFK